MGNGTGHIVETNGGGGGMLWKLEIIHCQHNLIVSYLHTSVASFVPLVQTGVLLMI